jgi:hypothetical protein
MIRLGRNRRRLLRIIDNWSTDCPQINEMMLVPSTSPNRFAPTMDLVLSVFPYLLSTLETILLSKYLLEMNLWVSSFAPVKSRL